MRRFLLILLAVIAVAVVGFVLWALLTPLPPAAEKAPPPAKRPPAPLQADAEGYYVPGYNFAIGYFRFARITLHPETYLTFSQTTTGTRHEIGCGDARIRADAIQLQCDDDQIGTVTVEGRFLTRVATSRLDTPVLSAFVTVRNRRGEVAYRARDSFVWHPVD